MEIIAPLFTLEGWISLLALTVLEIVLGIDNIIFISILTDKLPAAMKKQARFWGLVGALVMRIILLSFISFLTGMTNTLFSIDRFDFSGRDLILLSGGLFLLYKSAVELHEKINKPHHTEGSGKQVQSFASAIVQIILIDIVFSFDSILTAIAISNIKSDHDWSRNYFYDHHDYFLWCYCRIHQPTPHHENFGTNVFIDDWWNFGFGGFPFIHIERLFVHRLGLFIYG